MSNTKFLKLIVEDDFLDFTTTITESTADKPKEIRLVGPYIVADKINNNKRKYIFEELQPEVDRFVEEFVKTNRALGELEHPEYTKINPERAAIKIESLTLNESERVWIGESIILESDPRHNIKGTPQGDILAGLVQRNVKVGFSTRGVGNIKGDTVREYKICTIDCVTNPSIGVFCEGILESKDYIIDRHGVVVESSYLDLEKRLKTLPNKDKQEYLTMVIKKFFENI